MSEMPALKSNFLEEIIYKDDFISFPERIRNVAKNFPELNVLTVDGETRQWKGFMPRINQVSNMLAGRGLGRGSKIAVLAKSSIEYIEIFLGGLQAGVCIVPLSGMASSEQLKDMIRDSGSKMVFVSEDNKHYIEPFIGKLDAVPADGYVALDFSDKAWTPYEPLVSSESESAMSVDILPEDPFNLIYSSGTTGVPKGIEQSHSMRNQHVVGFEALGVSSKSVTLSSTALYSNTTLVVLLPTLALGGRIVLMPKFATEEFLKLAEAEKVTHTMLVPVQYQRILDHKNFHKYDLSSFQIKVSTSAPLREGIKQQAIDKWPGKLIEVYGLTEGGIGTVLSVTDFPDKLASVGRVSEGVDLRIIDEQGAELPQGEIGEIVGRSSAMMSGYYNRPDLTNDMLWTCSEGKTYFKSGDIGRFDEDGFLFLLDRKKDMIISGGFNIYAADIEAELVQHSGISDVAVIGIPSESWGETPLALVVLKEGATHTEKDITDWVNNRLGKTQRISGVEFRSTLPRSTIGKIKKKELRDEYVTK
ncbi:class I adenylate-forming enzyme family protein [Paraglaciecola arctica]|uniref:AMP-dependent synthetase and ligase n=1 Tax=Paraglaciecola arctica BSs20135 TaxID=493475 RepID=K6ZEI7_9ALTE|nr:class I adenylate-forming enzyme family protein [Paraglaciecola arctica]GAC21805.1 AMP-dependent synthetase and ligase [Paraglaciecola arctica BSs20135]